ncbi:hypothetical protein [Streptomyces sp. NRRL F-3307]|uniref:hypothetical protein n=1 Tax=Streptomyces TaxID=1883 RepID=UPI00131CBB5A
MRLEAAVTAPKSGTSPVPRLPSPVSRPPSPASPIRIQQMEVGDLLLELLELT